MRYLDIAVTALLYFDAVVSGCLALLSFIEYLGRSFLPRGFLALLLSIVKHQCRLSVVGFVYILSILQNPFILLSLNFMKCVLRDSSSNCGKSCHTLIQISSSILLLNADSAVAPLSLALLGILVL